MVVQTYWSSSHGPHQVFASVVVNTLSDIATDKQSYYCRLVLTLEWMLSEGDRESYDAKGKSWVPSWTPPIPVLPNAISFEIGDPSYQVRQYDQMVMGKSTVVIAGTFSEELELENFPFDCQDLQLELEWPSSVEEMKVWPNFGSSFVTVDARKMVMSEWRLHPPIAEFKSNKVETVGKDLQMVHETHSVLLIRFKVSRNATPYLYQIFLIMSLICACSLMSFSMYVGDSGDRLAQATTMFLTAMAFQFVISSMLPKLDYLTLVDKYILTCNVFISVIVFQVGMVALVQSHLDIVVTTGFDFCLLLANIVVFALVHVVLAITVKFKVIPVEELKLSSSSRVLRDLGVRKSVETLKISYEKFHTTTIDDNKGVQTANYLGSDQVKGKTVTGVYFSDDYGHGREYFAVSVATNDKNQDQLLLRKITGDENVPAGRLSVRTDSEVPKRGGDSVAGAIQIRRDVRDLNGFQWWDVRVSVIDFNTIVADLGLRKMIFKRALKDNYEKEEEEEKEVVEEDYEDEEGGEDAAGEPGDGLDGAAGSDTVEVRAEGHHDGEGQAGGGDDEEAC